MDRRRSSRRRAGSGKRYNSSPATAPEQSFGRLSPPSERDFPPPEPSPPMKLHQDLRIGRNMVTAYGDGYVAINGRRHTGSIVVLPERLIEDWVVPAFDALTEADFRRIAEICAETHVDILLFGTGTHQRFPQPTLLRPLIEARVGIEIMDTHAACRTYNILMAEDRSVAAALLIG